MDKQINDLISRVDALEKIFNLNQQNINFNIGLSWSILACVVTIIGAALYLLAKTWVESRVSKEFKTINQEIEDLKKAVSKQNGNIEKLIVDSGSHGDGYMFINQKTLICYLRAKVQTNLSNQPYTYDRTFLFPVSFNDVESIVPTVSVLKNKNISASIKSLSTGYITVEFNVSHIDNSTDEAEVSIIAIGNFVKSKSES